MSEPIRPDTRGDDPQVTTLEQLDLSFEPGTQMFVDELETRNRPGFVTRRHGWNWAHLATTGSLEELHRFARLCGVDFGYYRGRGGLTALRGHVPYYEINPGQRLTATRLGAKEVTSRELIDTVRAAFKARGERP